MGDDAMTFGERKSRIWLVRHAVDFRKQQNGLLAEAYKVNRDPFAGDVLIFIGRNRRRIKVLHADPTGLWVSAKVFTLEAMKTNFKFLSEPFCSVITHAELALLIEGAAYTIERKVAVYTKTIDVKGGISQSPASPQQ
jgi:IS66 Orf2 like protein